MARWAENPYWQHFCGETFFQHRQPIDPSSLTRCRNRIGEEGVEWLLTETIAAGKRSGAVKGSDLKRVTVDTTVMEKNMAQFTNRMHGPPIAVARQVRGEAFSSSRRWNHRR